MIHAYNVFNIYIFMGDPMWVKNFNKIMNSSIFRTKSFSRRHYSETAVLKLSVTEWFKSFLNVY